MYKTKITYKDVNGDKITKELCFCLSRIDILMASRSKDTDFDIIVNDMSNEKDSNKLMQIFNKVLKQSYGELSSDGVEFIKNEEIWKRFKDSKAYEVMCKEFLEDTNKITKFMKAILPKEVHNLINIKCVSKKEIKDNV